MSIPFRLDEAKLQEGLAHLAQVDEDFARALALHGPPPLRRLDEGFAALLRAIVGQQVSVKAAASIWGRFETACGTVTPERVLELDDAALRAVGLSGGKMRYSRGLALDTREQRIVFEALSALEDQAVIDMLTQAKGIGRWTAEMYLMFALGRPDVMPAADLGLIVAAQHLKRMRKRPDSKRLLKLAEAWRPWRSVAALFLWHYRRTMPDWSEGRGATPKTPSPERVKPNAARAPRETAERGPLPIKAVRAASKDAGAKRKPAAATATARKPTTRQSTARKADKPRARA